MRKRQHGRFGSPLLALLVAGCLHPGSAERERAIGSEEARKVEEQVGLVEDAALAAYVESIGRRLAAQLPERRFEFAFRVVDLPEPNAFALPGGYVYVSRGLLPLANSEDELAGVIGHEVAHVASSHFARQSLVGAPFAIVTGLGALATGIVSPRLGRVVAGLGSAVAGGLVLAPYSRQQETQADRQGQALAARAGWDPAALASFLRTLEREAVLQREGRSPLRFFATHPSTEDRVERTTREAQKLRRAERAPTAAGRDRFLARLDGMRLGENPAEGVFQDGRFVHPDLDFTLRFPDGWKTQNARGFVAARDADAAVYSLLELAAEGNDPTAAARKVVEEANISLSDGLEKVRIGTLPAAHGVAVVRGAKGRVGLDLTWIAHGGRVYQLTGVSPADRFERDRPRFAAIAASFRPLTEADRSGIQVARLRIVPARGGETLEQLVARTKAAWTPEQAAVANDLPLEAALEQGQAIKLALREPYLSRP